MKPNKLQTRGKKSKYFSSWTKKEELWQKLIQLDVIWQATVSFSTKTCCTLLYVLFFEQVKKVETLNYEKPLPIQNSKVPSRLELCKDKIARIVQQVVVFALGCRLIRYCCKKCQVDDWNSHEIFIHTFIMGSKWKEVSVWS